MNKSMYLIVRMLRKQWVITTKLRTITFSQHHYTSFTMDCRSRWEDCMDKKDLSYPNKEFRSSLIPDMPTLRHFEWFSRHCPDKKIGRSEWETFEILAPFLPGSYYYVIKLSPNLSSQQYEFCKLEQSVWWLTTNRKNRLVYGPHWDLFLDCKMGHCVCSSWSCLSDLGRNYRCLSQSRRLDWEPAVVLLM